MCNLARAWSLHLSMTSLAEKRGAEDFGTLFMYPYQGFQGF